MAQLIIELHALRLAGVLHAFAELPEDRILLHLDTSLIAVSADDLPFLADRPPVQLAPPGPGTLLAEDLFVDDAFAWDPHSRRVFVAHAKEFLRIDPCIDYNPQRIPFEGINRGTFAAAIDSEGRRILLAVAKPVHFDFAHYALILADLSTGKVIEEPSISAAGALELFWDRHRRAWMIGDTLTGTLWCWDVQSPARRLGPPPAGTRASLVSFTDAPDGVFVSALVAQRDGTLQLAHGRADKNQIAWASPIPLKNAPAPSFARRSPSQSNVNPLWACLAESPIGQQIQLRDPTGNVLASTNLPPGLAFQNLLWSPYHPTRLWATAPRALAQVNLSQ